MARHQTQHMAAQGSKQAEERASGQRPVAAQSSNGSGPALCSSGRHVAVLFFVFCFIICRPPSCCVCVFALCVGRACSVKGDVA